MPMILTRFLLATLCLVSWPGLGRAQAAAEFLRSGFGARSLALGNCMLAAEGDPACVYWNPALLLSVPRNSAEVAHTENFGGATGYDTFGFAGPLGRERREAIGIGLVRLAVDDIPTTEKFSFQDLGSDGRPGTHDPGEGNGRWDPGEPVETDPNRVVWRSDAEWALLLGYARALGPRGSVGGAVKYVRQGLAGHQATGFAVDVAAAVELSRGLQVAARFLNLTATRLVWDTGARETIRPDLEAAVSQSVVLRPGNTLRFLLAASSSVQDLSRAGGPAAFGGGLEFAYRTRLFLRAGAASGEPAFGAGLALSRFRVDYATTPFHELGATHRVSALARW